MAGKARNEEQKIEKWHFQKRKCGGRSQERRDINILHRLKVFNYIQDPHGVVLSTRSANVVFLLH